ncbi:Alpha/Beta hydrolase protein [Cyathus striatus]|nr:Alpha/Beta hydrolase protein [Cyathus striatus]
MIDHLAGRPSPSWKRTQVFLVIFFWLWRIVRGNTGPPRILWLPRLNKALKRFTPWQIIMSSLTAVYAMRNFDKILGLSAPEPLARLYSPSYYRATWIATGLDAGFATAMSIRPKWLRDISSIIFAAYYILYPNEAEEKLRRFRAVPTVEMLRTTWEKTTNPYIRLGVHLPKISIRQKILLPRPKVSSYDRPITAYFFFAPPRDQLALATELILDFPGGGFIAMTPEHHEERLRMWAVKTNRPVLSIEYGKAPEYPFPFASDEVFDVYRLLVESRGALIGMSGRKLDVIISGDSAGATLAVNAMVKILEHNQLCVSTHQGPLLPIPTAIVLSYAALDFNFTSWMSDQNLRVLRSEQSSGNLPELHELAAQKDHLQHVSPLSMVTDRKTSTSRKKLQRKSSWKEAFRGFASGGEKERELPSSSLRRNASSPKASSNHRLPARVGSQSDDKGALADAESEEDEDYNNLREEDRPIQARVRYAYPQGNRAPDIQRSELSLKQQQQELSAAVAEANARATMAVAARRPGKAKEPIGTRLTMTSRTGYFQDPVISPSMMRAMAILYIGPHRNPDFETDYHISPILTPAHLLAQFPPLLMQCGEKDPFVDDTVIFAGRVREAKRARKIELDLALSGKSARFGESIRMSTIEASTDSRRVAEMKKEREKLAGESENEWVEMVLFSDWSHGYLQMPTLMSEARAVIDDIGEWIEDSFIRRRSQTQENSSSSSRNGARDLVTQKERPAVSHLTVPQTSSRGTNISPMTSETETETESGITFVPKKYQDESRRGSFGGGGGKSGPAVRGYSPGSDSTLLGESGSGESAVEPDGDGGVQGRGNGGRVGGQTISEGELMRRRRLLDAHIFE